MTQTRFKKVPFNLELAKKITNKEMKGRIVTEDGLIARIVCFNATYGYVLPLSKITERLIGTNKSYEELIQGLDAELTKNEEQ